MNNETSKIRGVLIADEQGLGKTIQAIGVINSLPEVRRVLVVAKAKLKLNWKQELEKWIVRPMTIGLASGQEWPDTEIVIANYDILHKWGKQLSQHWCLCICDEVQHAKTPTTRRSKALFGDRKAGGGVNARLRIALSGTPVENRPIEIQPVLAWLQPDNPAWSNRFAFAKRYCAAKHNGFGWDFSGASNLDELRSKLRQSVMVRRLKADVLKELPTKSRTVIAIDADGAMRACVQREEAFLQDNLSAIEQAQARLELAKAGSIDELEGAVAQLREAQRVHFSQMSRLRYETAMAKLPAAIEFIKEELEEVKKLVVFAHHKDVIAGLQAAFPNSVSVTGESSIEDAQAAKDRFQSDPSLPLFFGSIRAAGEGITLTAASNVLFVELDWTPGKMLQAESRCHRIGTTSNVLVKYLVVDGSLDQRIMDTLISKMKVIEQGLDKGDDVRYEQRLPVLPVRYDSAKRSELDSVALGLTDARIAEIHADLRRLAGVCDGASKRDGAGFAGPDVAIGHSLANSPSLTPRQAALGLRLTTKYRRQLGKE